MSDAAPTPDLRLLAEHRGWVRALARRLLRDENDVDDVEQETFAVALRKGPDEPRALRTWLGVVASRLALQRRRGETRRARREEAMAAPEGGVSATADVVAEADAHGNVVQAVRALAEPYRTTVLLRWFEDLPVAEVARRMEVPVETVRTRLKRAHAQLRTALEREHGRPLAVLLAPIAGVPPAVATGAAVATTSAAASFAKAAALAGAGAGVVALGAWIVVGELSGERKDVPAQTAAAPAPAPAPRGGGVPGRDGAPGSDGENGKDGAPGQDGTDGADGAPAPSAVDPAGPAPKPATPAADATTPDAWTAFDLADGRPLAGFALRVRTASGESVVRTDDAGRVPVERTQVLNLTADDATTWTLAKPDKGEVRAEPSLWFWRERAVSGTVKSADPSRPLAEQDVKLTWSRPFTAGDAPDAAGSGFRWFMQHGFDPRGDHSHHLRVDATGAISGTAPAVRDAMLAAEAPGLGSDAAPLVWADDGACIVSFTLASKIRIVGRLLDAAGDPVVGESVSFASSFEVKTLAEARRAMVLRNDGGIGYAGRGDTGIGTVTYFNTAQTDVRGIFRFDVKPIGSAVVTVMKPGFLACRHEIGPLEKDVFGFEMSLAPSDVRVRFTVAGKPTGVGLQVDDHRENGFALELGADGRVDAGWLQKGRWYRVVAGGQNVCFRWDGQSSIDLDTLPKEPPKNR